MKQRPAAKSALKFILKFEAILVFSLLSAHFFISAPQCFSYLITIIIQLPLPRVFSSYGGKPRLGLLHFILGSSFMFIGLILDSCSNRDMPQHANMRGEK